MKLKLKLQAISVVGLGLMTALAAQAAPDADAAQSLMRKSDCFKCHAVDKKKDGPAFKEVARKLKGKADAQDKILKNITTGPKVKLLDSGKEEEHKIIDTKDPKELKNLTEWILSH